MGFDARATEIIAVKAAEGPVSNAQQTALDLKHSIGADYAADFNINGGVLKINAAQVVGEQQPAIPDATGQPITTAKDDEARATIDLVLTAMRTHGLIEL